jgi:DNA mismatch repair protein MutL
MEKGVSYGYRERLFEGRYPVCFLFLDVDPGKLDVNIHPSKDRIRFYDTEKTGAFIRENLLKGLATKDLVPHLNVRGEDPFFSDADEPIIKETIKSETKDWKYWLTISVGYAEFTGKEMTHEQLYALADAALYNDKNGTAPASSGTRD